MIHCVFQTVLVHTPETICLTYFMDLLLQRGKPIMLVGNAGVGKTILVSDKVAKLKEDYMVAKVPFNYYTTSAMLQRKNHMHNNIFRIGAKLVIHRESGNSRAMNRDKNTDETEIKQNIKEQHKMSCISHE